MDWILSRRMRAAQTVALAVFMILGTLSGIPGAQAQFGGSSHGEPGTVTLDVVDADLSQVVRLLMNDSRQNIVITDDPVLRQGKVTLTLRDVSLETALKYIVECVGGSWSRQPDGVYVIRGQASAPSTPPVQEAAVPLVDSFSTAHGRLSLDQGYQPRREMRGEKIYLHNTSPVDIMWALGLYRVEDAPRIHTNPRKPGVFLQREDGGVEPVHVPSRATPTMQDSFSSAFDYAERMTPSGFEAAQAMPPAPPSYPGQPGTPGVTTRPGTAARPAQAGQPGVGMPVQPGVGVPSQPGAGTGTQQSTGLLPEGIAYIMPYDMDNSLIVRGDEEGIAELKTLISMFDIAPKQVSIRAQFVSISTSELQSLGINWALDRMNTSFATNFSPAGNVVIGYATGNLMANLRAQLSQSDGQLVNAPLVTTINNVPAEISFLTQVPFQNTTTFYSDRGVPTTTSYVDTFDVMSRLWVLPRVNSGDNSITVLIMPEISDIEQMVSTGDSTLPIVASQRVQTIRRVANGETIVLGGLTRKDTKETVDKIPLLGDLPLIGQLFRSTTRSTDDKELLILLTPTIVPERSVAGTGIGVMP